MARDGALAVTEGWCEWRPRPCRVCRQSVVTEYGRLLTPRDRDFRYQAREYFIYDAADPAERHHCPPYVYQHVQERAVRSRPSRAAM